jgi:methionyl-tRNA formyltransferase
VFLDRVDRGGVTLQRLTEDLDAGEIVCIHDVEITDTKSWLDVLTRLYETALVLLPTA